MAKYTNLTFATGNENKVKEARQYLKEFTITQYETDLLEIRSDDLEEIAIESVKAVEGSVKRPVFVEDSGIFVSALNGFPGPISGYAYNKLGAKKILSLMNSIQDRSAYFETVIAFETPEGEILTFKGRTNGRILEEKVGSRGFDYDPLFMPEGDERTFAEMSIAEKNEYSHRGKALNKLRDYLLE